MKLKYLYNFSLCLYIIRMRLKYDNF